MNIRHIVLLAIAMPFIAYAQNKTEAGKIDYKAMGAPMPPLCYVTKDGRVRQPEIKPQRKSIVMLFDPVCDHCQKQTQIFEENIEQFGKWNIVLQAMPDLYNFLPFFEKATHVSQYPQIQVGADSCGLMNKIYVYMPLPQVNIYDKDKRLIKTFTGVTPIDSFKAYFD